MSSPPERDPTPSSKPDTGEPSSLTRSATSGATFAFANAAQRALLFLLLPAYTAVLTPSAYGRLGLLITLQGGAIILLQAGMEASITRHYFTLSSSSARNRFIQSSWRFLGVLAPGLGLLTAAVLLIGIRSSDVFRVGEAALTLLSAATFVVATVVPLTVLRLEQRLRDYIAMTAAIAVATTGLTVLAVVILKLEIVGWFAAATVANVIVLVFAFRVVPARRIDRYDRGGVRTAVRLGVGLVPHAGSLWALSLADRVVLATLVAPSKLGVYTLAANLSIPAMVIIQSMNQGFLPSYSRAQHRDSADAASLDRIAGLQIALVVAVSMAAAVLAAPIIGLLNPAYAESTSVVPWLALGGAFWGFYQIPMNVISLVAGRTQYVWLLGLTSAAIGVGSLFVLVPEWGLNGAGIASAIGYLALLTGTLIYLRALGESLPLRLSAAATAVAIGLATYAVASLAAPTGIAGFSIRLIAVGFGIAALSAVGGIRPRHLQAAVNRVRKV